MTYSQGVTPTERYLYRLSQRTFLRLWSYSGLFRDQGVKARGGEGAELCDLLVVFGQHVLIFSDKDCEFPSLPDADVAWGRWFKKAILKSAHQVWGAERWLCRFPDRVFLDRRCTERLPIAIPDPATARFHRIVVAHDHSGRLKAATPGSGTLKIDLRQVGEEAHSLPASQGGHPFAVGHLMPGRGFVHVFDEIALDLCMLTLDTVTDFVAYLSAKEDLIASGRFVGAFGEEEVLGNYLAHVDESGNHAFRLPDVDRIVLSAGHWKSLWDSPSYQRKLEADKVSYQWDRMIDDVAGHVVDGTLAFTTNPSIRAHEEMLRIVASESRFRRRILAGHLDEVVTDTTAVRGRIRVVSPSRPGEPYYVFIAGGPPPWAKDDTKVAAYMEQRRDLLADYCWCLASTFDDANTVIGFATEGGLSKLRSWSSVLVCKNDLSADDQAEGRRVAAAEGWFKNLLKVGFSEVEYPPADSLPRRIGLPIARGASRNAPCPCGSGMKFKKCHGR